MQNNVIYETNRIFWPASAPASKIPISISGNTTASASETVQAATQTIADDYVQKKNVLTDLNKIASQQEHGLIDWHLLPSYVSEIKVYSTFSAFPNEPTGDQVNAIFVAEDTSISYRWADSKYTKVGDLSEWKLKVLNNEGEEWEEISAKPGTSELSLDLSNKRDKTDLLIYGNQGYPYWTISTKSGENEDSIYSNGKYEFDSNSNTWVLNNFRVIRRKPNTDENIFQLIADPGQDKEGVMLEFTGFTNHEISSFEYNDLVATNVYINISEQDTLGSTYKIISAQGTADYAYYIANNNATYKRDKSDDSVKFIWNWSQSGKYSENFSWNISNKRWESGIGEYIIGSQFGDEKSSFSLYRSDGDLVYTWTGLSVDVPGYFEDPSEQMLLSAEIKDDSIALNENLKTIYIETKTLSENIETINNEKLSITKIYNVGNSQPTCTFDWVDDLYTLEGKFTADPISANITGNVNIRVDGNLKGGNLIAQSSGNRPATWYGKDKITHQPVNGGSYEYSFPSVSGTLALTSDISNEISDTVMPLIDKISTDISDISDYIADDGNRLVRYAVCNTAGGVSDKVAIIEDNKGDFSLTKGAVVVVHFTSDCGRQTATLSINGSESAPIYRRGINNSGTDVGTNAWSAKEAVPFVYDGNEWIILRKPVASSNEYGVVRITDSISGNATDVAISQRGVYTLSTNLTGQISSLSGIVSSLNNTCLRTSGDQTISSMSSGLILSAFSTSSDIRLKLNSSSSATYTSYGLNNIIYKPSSAVSGYTLTFPNQRGQLGLKYNISYPITAQSAQLSDETFNIITPLSTSCTLIFPTVISNTARDFIAYVNGSSLTSDLNLTFPTSNITYKSDDENALSQTIPSASEVLFRFTEINNNVFYVTKTQISTIQPS